MKQLDNLSSIEMLKIINDLNTNHETLKKEIIELTYKIDEINLLINKKIDALKEIEKEYVECFEELNSRDPNYNK